MSHDVTQEPEDLRARPVTLVSVATFVVFVAAIIVASVLLRCNLMAYGLEAEAATRIDVTTPREIGGVEQTDLRRDRYGLELLEQQRRELESFGWVDRERGLVRIPIEDAMRWVVEGRR